MYNAAPQSQKSTAQTELTGLARADAGSNLKGFVRSKPRSWIGEVVPGFVEFEVAVPRLRPA